MNVYSRNPASSSDVPPATFGRHGLHASVEGCILGAKATLGHDPVTAHDLLDRLSDLLSGGHATEQLHAVLPEPVVTDRQRAGGLARWQLLRVMTFVDAHLSETIRVGTLARHVRLSSGYFSRAFKISTGDTPHNYIIRQRVRRAQILMLSTAEPLSEIALICGFTDQAHMTRYFSRHAEHTPFVWRRTFKAA